MAARGLSSSPLARLLLELASRGADGTIRVGGRVLVLRRGGLVDVSPAVGDESLEEFMVRAGRLRPERARDATKAVSAGVSSEAALRASGVPEVEVRNARRAMLLDRFVRGLAAAESDGSEVAAFEPDATADVDGIAEPLPAMLLDALARRAGESDAGLVGERAQAILRFAEGPHLVAARAWSGLGDASEGQHVYECLKRSPAAASRIAALVRAGIVVLQPDRQSAPPPARPKSMAPPPPVAATRPPSLRAPSAVPSIRPPVARPEPSSAPRFRDTLRPGAGTSHREPIRRLDPGETRIDASEFDVAGESPELPPDVGPLKDPLDDGERLIATLEQSQASGAERAEAWLALARLWLRHHRSIEEAARAAREAAAADPSSLPALRESSAFCAALGRLDLARAYARAATRVATDPAQLADCHLELARLDARAGDVESERVSLEAAVEAHPNARVYARIARLRAGAGEASGAVEAAFRAGSLELEGNPTATRAWAEIVLDADPVHVDAMLLDLRATEALGRHAAGAVLTAHRARHLPDADSRARLLTAASEAAEREGRGDLALAFLDEATAGSASKTDAVAALVAHAAAAHDTTLRAILLEDAARHASPERVASLLVEAADALEQASPTHPWASELRARALVLEPADDAIAASVRRLAEGARDLDFYADALERAIRASVGRSVDGVERRMQELAIVSETTLSAPHRASWALSRLEERLRSRLPDADAPTQRALEGMLDEVRSRGALLASKTTLGFELLSLAESDFQNAPPEQRPHAERKLASLLRELPDERALAVAMYRNVLAGSPEDAAAALSLDRLLALASDDAARLEFALARLGVSKDPIERLRFASTAMGLASLLGRPVDIVRAGRVALELAPEHRDAALRVERAAALIGDVESERLALERVVALATTLSEQVAALVRRARLEERAGDATSAVYYAEAAHERDPKCLEALPVLLAHVDILEASRALAVTDSALAAWGPTPGLLGLGVHFARELGDHAKASAYVDARCRIGDDPIAIAPLRVERALEDADPAVLRVATEQALSLAAIGPSTADVVEQAIERLGAFDPGDASTVALLAVDRLGDGRFVFLAHRFAEQSGLWERRLASMERAIAFTAGDDRATNLRVLALVYREAGERAREARTYLRLLAEAPDARDAWERLTELYAEAREPERLLAILAIRLEAAAGPQEREQRLLHLALASLVVAGDAERAEGFLRRLVSESSEPARAVHRSAALLVRWGAPDRSVAWLRGFADAAADEPSAKLFEHAVHVAETHLGDASLALDVAVAGLSRAPTSPALLVAFERAALTLGDVDVAKATYGTLAERAFGTHGRRGLRYREARWLERAGRTQDALETYVACFALAPSDGVVFQSLERLSAAQGRWDLLVDALLRLVELAPHLDRRMALLHNTVALCEGPLDDPARAFELLFEAWRSTGRSELLTDVRRLSRKLATRDASRATRAIDEIVSVLGSRVDMSWDADDQIRCLRILASVEWEERRDLGAALAHVDRGVTIAKENDDADRVEAAELECDAARFLLDAGRRAEGLAHSESALTLVADHERAIRLRMEASGAAVLQKASGPATEPTPHAPPTVEAPPLDVAKDSWHSPPGEEPKKPVRASVPADDHERDLATRSARGDTEALAEWATLLSETQGREVEAVRVLRSLLRADPARTDAWRKLAPLAEKTGRKELAEVAGAVVSTFDPSGAATPGARRLVSTLEGELATLVRDPSDEPTLEVLSLLWEGALPLFRRTLASYGLLGTQRVPPLSTRPLARAHADALLTLGRAEVPLFVRDDGDVDVAILPTQPPSIVVRSSIEDAPELLPFRLSRAILLASPWAVLVASADDARARVLVEAVPAAFGDPERSGEVGREAAAVGAELWHTVPTRLQSRLHDAMRRAEGGFTLATVRATIEAIAARAALLCGGGTRHAIESLARDDANVARHGIASDDGFHHACHASPALAAMLRFALSDEYLATLREPESPLAN